MRKFGFIFLSLLVLSALFAPRGAAQLRTQPLDRLDWYNPWIGNGNMAGLTLNRDFLVEDKDAISEAWIGAQGRFGEYRNVFDPQQGLDTYLGVESFGKVNNIFLYGRFKFSYDYDWGNSWRGSLHPYDSPFMLADPVVGNITTQFYSMEAGVGIPLGSGWNIGVDAAYDVGVMAKLKDLRNSNTDMTFRIAPGVSLNSDAVNLGLSLGYERSTEKVDYTKVASSTENYLYYLYGMWVYNSYGYSSAETSRFNAGDKVYGNFTIDVCADDWRFYDDFAYSRKWASQTENGYNNLIYGDTGTGEYSNRLTFQYCDNHRASLYLALKSSSADRYIQQQEQDKASGIRRWVTYGTEPCWSRQILDLSLSYEYRLPFVWELGGGVAYRSNEQYYVVNPLSISQTFTCATPFLRYSRFVRGRFTRWEFTPAASYRFMIKSIANDISCPDGTTVGDIQLLEPLYREADFFGKDALTASLSVCCDFWRMYAKADYGIIWAPSLSACRHSVGLKVGIAF